MPILKINTNLPKSKIPKDFEHKIIHILANVMKKDESTFIIVVNAEVSINMFGSTTTPSAVATLESVGKVGNELNHHIVKEISHFVEKELGIHPKRFVVSIYDLKTHSLGVAGTTGNFISSDYDTRH